jgi:ATP-dependent DNA helicase RecG
VARRLTKLATLPVTELKGVGESKAKALAEVGITSVLDLLTHYPRRYLDRTKEAKIADLEIGDQAMVLVEVLRVASRPTKNRRRMVVADASDETGRLKLTFFNQPWREKQLRPGLQAVVYGKLESFRGTRQMTNPIVDLIGDKTGRIIPVYPQSEKAGVMTWDLAKMVDEALRRAGEFAEPVDDTFLRRFDFVDRTTAFRAIHLPQSMAEVSDARRRLVFDELLRVQVELVRRKRKLEAETVGLAHVVDGSLTRAFVEGLPFPLTGAQERAMAELDHDLERSIPMHRLLQGDVGAGKTLVAVHALLVGVQGGHQGALMAPTEVLAEQHSLSVRALVGGLEVGDEANLFGQRPLRVELLTNRVQGNERKQILEDLAAGGVDIVIGTHALIQEAVEFHSLGVVVVDEQHRFGVEQRAALRAKSPGDVVPDVLVMTATPIPRTAAMTVYGDLDVTVLDELPPGRTPIDTVWARGPLEQEAVWQRVRDEVADGRQAYVVCPLIDESDKLQVSAAEEVYGRLISDDGELAGLRVGLLHGRIPALEKDRVMSLFRAGQLDVLVATTVIEVGVDVPNATVMVVLDADRFGIAQLHQLRGRVGRGADASVCFLVGDPTTPEGEERLKAMVRTTDGFELAEIDLDLRGEGTIMGERQKGRNDLKLASLRRDREWVERAREVAIEILDADPTLEQHELLAEEVDVLLGDEEAAEFLLKS